MVAQQLRRQQGLDPSVKIIFRDLGQPPDGLITEDRLQHALSEHRRTTRHADLGPDQPAGVGEDHDHQRHTDPVDAESHESGFGPLAHALVGNKIKDGTLPVPDGPGRPSLELRRGSGKVEVAGLDQLPARRMGLPGRLGALRGGVPLAAQQRLQPGFDRYLQIRGAGGFSFERGDQPVPQPADLLLQGAEELAGADEFVPASQYLPAQQRPVGGLHLHGADGLGVGVIHLGPERVDHLELLVDRCGEPWRPSHQRTDRAVERPVDHLGPAGLIVGDAGQPAANRLDGGGRQQALFVDGGLRDGEQRRSGQPTLAHQLAEVRRDLRHGPRRDPVEHHRHGGAAFGGRQQELPRHGVGITGRRGDEEPQVGGRQQLSRELPVLRDDRVDVRSVEDGQTLRNRVVDHQDQRPRVVRGSAGPRQSGQDPVVSEPPGVVAVMDQYRCSGGRPDDPRGGDLAPDQRVDQRRLPRAGRSADDSEERRVDGGEPGQDVVVQLAGDLAYGALLFGGVGQRERQPNRGDRRAQLGESSLQRRLNDAQLDPGLAICPPPTPREASSWDRPPNTG